NDNQYFVRIDHTFSASDKIFFRYATNIPDWFTIAENSNFSYRIEARNNNYASQWLHLFSPTIVNEFRFGETESRDDSFNPRANTNFSLDSIGITGFNVLTDNNRPLNSREAGIPTMNITGFLTMAERDGGNGYDKNKLFQFGDSISINTGPHTFKGGV